MMNLFKKFKINKIVTKIYKYSFISKQDEEYIDLVKDLCLATIFTSCTYIHT